MTTRLRRMSLRPLVRFYALLASAMACGSVTVAQPQIGVELSTSSFARNAAPAGFEENKGQVKTTLGEPAPFVRFRLTRASTHIFLLPRGVAYQFDRVHQPEGLTELRGKHWRNSEDEARLAAMEKEVRLETYRMDMELEGADLNARVTREGRSTDRTNYYNHGALDVHTYGHVIYHDVYPGIDWSITARESGIEYDFIVHPGGDPSDIRMRYLHHEELGLTNSGELIHGNRLGRFTEALPVSFQGEKRIPTRFVLHEDVVKFAVDVYDKRKELRIDPPRQWGTYYGGTQDDFAYSVAVDGPGNVYMTGWTYSTNGIASPGAQQSNAAGEADGMIIKFSSAGQRLWGTYYGGSLGDAFTSCSISGTSIYVAGITLSTSGVATLGAHQTTPGGNWDGLLVKFDTGGSLQWGTYYGGSAEDRGRGCTVDQSGNVFLCGHSSSTQGISSGPGVHQSAFGGGSIGEVFSRGDGFLAKFNSSGTRLWATYYGGPSDDEAFSCAADASGNVYIAGGTGTSTGTAIASGNVHQPAFGGFGSDAFMAKFNSSGVRQWGTYYGGATNDYGFACAVDNNGNPVMAGDTDSQGPNGALNSGAAFQGSPGGNFDAFLVKFTPNGGRSWGTYYGGTNFDSGRGVTTGPDGNVYLIGETVSTNASAIAQFAHQGTFGGGEVDGYLAGFDDNGTRLFGTYYGGTLRDEGYSAAVTADSIIYFTGRSLSTNAISSPDAYQTDLAGGSDAFLVKFDYRPDCNSEPGGAVLPGTMCDDNDPCTIDDALNAVCVCAGTLLDADGDGIPDCTDNCPNVPGLIGDPCDDFNPCTINDMLTVSCVCAGTVDVTDSDGDGVPDCSDNCPNVVGEAGSACDDGNEQTLNDVITSSCICAGAPVSCVTSADCDDQNDCTYAMCSNGTCVYAPYQLDVIEGPTNVLLLGYYYYSIPFPTWADSIAWQLPDGWSSDEVNSNGLLVSIGTSALGPVSLCVTVDTSACTLDTCITVFVTSNIGMDEPGMEQPAMLVRPNPSHGSFQVSLPSGSSGPCNLTVLDMSGREMRTTSHPQGRLTWGVDVEKVQPGSYVLLVTRGDQLWTSRVLIMP